MQQWWNIIKYIHVERFVCVENPTDPRTETNIHLCIKTPRTVATLPNIKANTLDMWKERFTRTASDADWVFDQRETVTRCNLAKQFARLWRVGQQFVCFCLVCNVNTSQTKVQMQPSKSGQSTPTTGLKMPEYTVTTLSVRTLKTSKSLAIF